MSVQILLGDCREMLRTLPEESVHCVVTSPPYWGLRDYGVAGQLGLEPTLGEHIAVMVEVFREVRRVMRRDATLWLNYGDCYATTPNGRSAAAIKALGSDDRTFRDKPFSTIGGLLKPKDLCMMPNRVAIALQEDGWWVRSEIIWHKPNPMPESISDRPTVAHEKIFLLTRSERYHYDGDAVRTPIADSTAARLAQDVSAQQGSHRANGGTKTNGTMKAVAKKQDGHSRRRAGFNERYFTNKSESTPRKDGDRWGVNNGRGFDAAIMGANLRTVWTIPVAGFSGAHFATFPPELAERCIKAGCPIGGTVLDPFSGAGTTGLVADRLGRDAILIELNPEYAALAESRIRNDAPMFTKVRAAAPTSMQTHFEDFAGVPGQ